MCGGEGGAARGGDGVACMARYACKRRARGAERGSWAGPARHAWDRDPRAHVRMLAQRTVERFSTEYSESEKKKYTNEKTMTLYMVKPSVGFTTPHPMLTTSTSVRESVRFTVLKAMPAISSARFGTPGEASGAAGRASGAARVGLRGWGCAGEGGSEGGRDRVPRREGGRTAGADRAC